MNAARTGRPRKLTEADIAEAVLAEGFAGLTVPAVAQRLGVSTMTLYRYTPTRAGLLALTWDHVLDKTTWPPVTGHWREILHRHATTLWDLLATHPGAVTELSGAVVPPRMMGLYDDLALALTEQGFTADQAVLAVDTTIDLTIDHCRGVEDLSRREDAASADTREQLAALWTLRPEDPPGRAGVRAAMQEAIATPPRDWFIRKLELMLDGLTTRRIAAADPRQGTFEGEDTP
ncbi:TetR family transcriptional regulator [Solwaraspora sp. WMMD406]|uniref:helix-turn-helix domain-containing protein n=1 Tax=Solwaraspora sp. WMMD406 TaxID=3016095 RepID=UPI00241734AB|nr:helix-turn-helix domain-containing protein [Solwaraspora sp. WMMD406]MDG4765272.1 TetR family transcriptional regulator [Solwaraspora sp. WMMD406]